MSNYRTVADLRAAYASKLVTKKDAEAYARSHANTLTDPASNPGIAEFQEAMLWMNLDLSDIKPAERKPDPVVGDYADIMAERAFFLREYAARIEAGSVWPDNMPEDMLDSYAEAVKTSIEAFKLGEEFTASQAWTDKQLAGFTSRKLQGGHLARIAARNAGKEKRNDLDEHLSELAEQDGATKGTVYMTDDLHRETSQYTSEEVNHENRSMRLPRWSSVAARGKTGNLTGWTLVGVEGTRAGKPCVTDQRLVYRESGSNHEMKVFPTLEDLEGWINEIS